MLYGLILCVLGIYLSGIITGICIVRYGLGLGSKLHIKAKLNLPLDADVQETMIEQEFTK